MTADSPYVVDDLDSLDPDMLFTEPREQVVVAVKVAPVLGQLELGLLATVVDEANDRGFSLTREHLRDDWLVCVFSAYDDEEE